MSTICLAPITASASDRSTSISRASFSSDPNITPRKIVIVPPPSSPKRRMIKTFMARHVHPQAIDAKLDTKIRREKALLSNANSQWQRSPRVPNARKRCETRAHTPIHLTPPPSEADQQTTAEFLALLEERHLHNRYLEIADRDGDGEIDTNWETSQDKRFNPVPMMSPKRTPFDARLFPGFEKLFFVRDYKTFENKKERTPLSLLTSPRWSGRNFMNPAGFSAPPGLRHQAPLNSDIRGPLSIIPSLVSTRRRAKQKQKVLDHPASWKTTFTPNSFEEPRSHPSHFQSMRAADFSTGTISSIRQGKWSGPPKHEFEKRINHHFHGTYGDRNLHT